MMLTPCRNDTTLRVAWPRGRFSDKVWLPGPYFHVVGNAALIRLAVL